MTRAVLSGSAAFIAGVGTLQLVSALRMPGFWAGSLPITYIWEGTLLIGGTVYLGPPIVALIIASMRSGGGIRLLTSCAVPFAWFCLLFLIWAWKPWHYYRQFPWSGLEQHLLPLVPVACVVGLVFWAAERTRRSNPRLQRTALRAAAEPPGR